MKHITSTHALNVDVHWLVLTQQDVLQMIARLGVIVPEGARFELFTEDADGFVHIEWQTPKAPK